MATESPSLKRVKLLIKKSQNPLFEKWLKEWRDEAAKNGSEMRHVFNRALKSLQKFPLRLNTGKDCCILENFGSKLCKMLDNKLESYRALHPEDESTKVRQIENIIEEEENANVDIIDIIKEKNVSEGKGRKRKSNGGNTSRKKKVDAGGESNHSNNKLYLPAHKSGAYAILMTLYTKMQEDNFKGYMTRSEIQSQGQVFCDSSFTKPLPGSHYTAWSSMGVLIRKKLVAKEGNPAKFSLTSEGIDVVIKLKERDVENPPSSSPEKNVASQSDQEASSGGSGCAKTSSSEFLGDVLSQEREPECDEVIFMQPGSFEIKLAVDIQERDEKFQEGRVKIGNRHFTNFEMRHLKVGDFIWIASDNLGRELVLPYIVERKRMDDLASSIKDGRFHEQKVGAMQFRLRHSGIENLIYLVEKYGNENQRLGLPMPTLLQAMANTQVLGGFTVKVTNNHEHSMRYLNCLTMRLSQLFQTKTLMSCKKSDLSPVNLSDDLIPLLTFKEFNKGSEKNKKPTVRNMFIKHLMQLNGVSLEKARAIVELYPTPKALMQGLKQPSGEKSIADLTSGTFNRAIGPAVARQIYLLMNLLDGVLAVVNLLSNKFIF